MYVYIIWHICIVRTSVVFHILAEAKAEAEAGAGLGAGGGTETHPPTAAGP